MNISEDASPSPRIDAPTFVTVRFIAGSFHSTTTPMRRTTAPRISRSRLQGGRVRVIPTTRGRRGEQQDEGRSRAKGRKTRRRRRKNDGIRRCALMRPRVEQTVAGTRYFKASFTGEIDLIEGIAGNEDRMRSQPASRFYACLRARPSSRPARFGTGRASPRAAHEVGEKERESRFPARPCDKTAIDAPAAESDPSSWTFLLYRIDRLDLCAKVSGIG